VKLPKTLKTCYWDLGAIHSVGFSGALANPLLASESAVNRLNDTLLKEFVAAGLAKCLS